MPRKQGPQAQVAFKVDGELARLLEKLPNKSSFIRNAIAAQLGVVCPLCQGRGALPLGLHDHFAAVLREHRRRICDGCHTELTLAAGGSELAPEDVARVEQFLGGGPFYCRECYDGAVVCEECGWHIVAARLDEHQRDEHGRSD